MDETTERVEKLLALMLIHQMQGQSSQAKVAQLNMAGFTNIEIADLLGTSPASVAILLYQKKQASKSKKTTSTKAAKATK
jgi:transcriptional regulator